MYFYNIYLCDNMLLDSFRSVTPKTLPRVDIYKTRKRSVTKYTQPNILGIDLETQLYDLFRAESPTVRKSCFLGQVISHLSLLTDIPNIAYGSIYTNQILAKIENIINYILYNKLEICAKIYFNSYLKSNSFLKL